MRIFLGKNCESLFLNGFKIICGRLPRQRLAIISGEITWLKIGFNDPKYIKKTLRGKNLLDLLPENLNIETHRL